VIDPSRAISANTAVDNVAVADIEQESMVWLRRILGWSLHCNFPEHSLTSILANQFALRQ
jgi:hypothetical protein